TPASRARSIASGSKVLAAATMRTSPGSRPARSQAPAICSRIVVRFATRASGVGAAGTSRKVTEADSQEQKAHQEHHHHPHGDRRIGRPVKEGGGIPGPRGGGRAPLTAR